MRNLIAAVALAAAVPASAQTLGQAYSDLSTRMAASRQVMAAAAAVPAAADAPASALAAGADAPDFSLKGADGAWHAESDYAGRVVVLEFWAGYAAQTRAGAPARAALAARYAAKGVVMLDVGVGESSAQAFMAMAAPAANEVVLFDPDAQVLPLYGGTGVPMAVVVDAQGKVVAVVPGADAGRVEAAVRRALGL